MHFMLQFVISHVRHRMQFRGMWVRSVDWHGTVLLHSQLVSLYDPTDDLYLLVVRELDRMHVADEWETPWLRLEWVSYACGIPSQRRTYPGLGNITAATRESPCCKMVAVLFFGMRNHHTAGLSEHH